MIIINQPINRKYNNKQVAVKLLGKSLPSVPEDPTTETCPFVFGGQFEYNVFYHSDASDWKNDKSEFMFKRFLASDTVDIELHKNGVKVADLDDDSLGEYFPTFTGTTEQEQQKGYLLYWYNVASAYGLGKYTIKANLTVLGDATEWESDVYNLIVFTEERANRTVSIQSTQNGNIISSIFDYTGLQWHQQIRLNGAFNEDGETFEKKAYRTQNYKQKQIQDEIVENWSLELDLIPRGVSEFFIKDRLLSNEFNVSDYNIMNEKVHKLKGVYPESIEKTSFENNRNSNYLIKFTSKENNIIKRNF